MRRSGKALITIVVILAVFAVLTLVGSWLAKVNKPPGGMWNFPENSATLSDPIRFSALAYANPAIPKPITPKIDYVNFTVNWPGKPPGPWLIACQVAGKTSGTLYECVWDPKEYNVPAGTLEISFDVYDTNGNINKAPHGVRKVNYNPR